MNGGKAMFFIDALRINMDSLGQQGNFAFNYDHKLDDLFFRYGVRINPDLVQDIYSGAYPIVVGSMGDQPQIEMMPWPFFPVINKFGNHPIVKNLDAIYTRFLSSIDTVKAIGIRKTPLMLTSQYSRKLSVPVHVNVNDLHKDMNPSVMNKGPINVAYLLEGKFNSLYKNRFLPENAIKSSFKEQSVPNKIIVCSDGDLVRNEINNKNGQPFPLGYDPMTKNNFANKDFVTNALDYLLDENGIISAKKKEIKLRPLDKVKIREAKAKWQLINLTSPLILVVVFGLFRFFVRKRRYEGSGLHK
jgi:ABC-2 type transport system permease protein